MDTRDAARLIAPAVTAGGTWADLGAGTGTFTAALARLLGSKGRVYAVERDPRAISALDALAQRVPTESGSIAVIRGDFTERIDLPVLDGVLLANSLHFVNADAQSSLLARLASSLAANGALVIIEYDNRPRSRWVPFPVSLARLDELAREAGLAPPVVVGRRGSDYGGTMYAARIERRAKA